MEKISIARRRYERQNHPPLDGSGVNGALPKMAPHTPKSNFFFVERLRSFILPNVNLSPAEEKQFSVEIISGLEKPVKLVVTIRPGNPSASDKRFLTVEEAARILQISKHTIYRQLQQRNLNGIKVGRQWRILLKSLNTSEGQKEEY